MITLVFLGIHAGRRCILWRGACTEYRNDTSNIVWCDSTRPMVAVDVDAPLSWQVTPKGVRAVLAISPRR